MGRSRRRAPLAAGALTLALLTACSGPPAKHRPSSIATVPAVTSAPASISSPSISPFAISSPSVPPSAVAGSSTSPVRPTASTTHRPATRAPVPSKTAASSTASGTHASTAHALPLRLPTHDATQVITVVASSTGSTTATLRAWQRNSGSWQPVGPPVHAWLGSAGMSEQPSESTSATPMGSFTLTQAFGRDPDPGTALPYTHTTPEDWWISEPGPLYNTRQRCGSGCAFTPGDPNEHLYYEIPFYDYAVVIDYNTRNAPGGVRQGAGSAFFLHVSVGAPTAGCVSVPADEVVRLLRWLRPVAHPRILIGLR